MTSTNGKLRPTDGSWLAGFDAALDVVDQRIDREEIVRGRTISHRTVDPEPGDSIAGTSAFYPGHQAGWDTRAWRRALPPQVQAATYDARLVAARLLRRAADRLDRLDLLRWAMGAGDDRAGSAARGAGCSPAAGPTSLSPWSEGPARCSLSSRDSLGDALSRGKGRCVAEATRRDIDIDVPVPRPRRRPDRRGRHVPHGGRGLRRRRAAQLPPEMRLAGHRRLPGYVGILLECRGAAEAQKVHPEAHWHRGERRGGATPVMDGARLDRAGARSGVAAARRLRRAGGLEALAEIDGILTFKAARDTIREACFTPRTPGAPPGTQRPIGTNGTRPLGELPRRLGSGKDRSR
jgi:hypothetical protein